jgi:hypothetical protein
MKQPKVPRIIVVDHLNAGPPKKRGFFRKVTTCDYNSPEGVVRESFRKGMKEPEYRLRKTGEIVQISFSFTGLSDLEEYFHDMYGIGEFGGIGEC